MKYKVNWDNGNHACGTFPQVFDTEHDAQNFADDWVRMMNTENSEEFLDEPKGLDSEPLEGSYTAEVIEEANEPD